MAHTTFAHPGFASCLCAGLPDGERSRWRERSRAARAAPAKAPQGSVQGVGSAGDGATSQVIVAMNTESEPAAGFDPLVAWGCGEHVHEPLIQSTLITTDGSSTSKRSCHVLCVLR